MEGESIMTDHQFDSIIDMVDMILDGCKDLEQARRKLKSLRRNSEAGEASEKTEVN